MSITRRALLAGIGGCAALAPHARATGAGTPFLKRIGVKGVNVHAHILANAWWAPADVDAAGREALLAANARRSGAIFARAAEVLPEDRVSDYRADSEARAASWSMLEAARLYLDQCDAAGIELICNLTMDNLPVRGAGGSEHTSDFERLMADDQAVREAFPERVVSFAGVDPRRPDAVELFRRAVLAYGFAGYGEMIGSLWRVAPDDRERLYPLMEACGDLGVPAVIDATQTHGFSRPEQFDQLLSDFPDVAICLGGAGAGTVAEGEDPEAVYGAFINLAVRHPNAWLDFGDWQGVHIDLRTRARAGSASAALIGTLERSFAAGIGDRVMYGSDFPVFANLYTEADWIEAVAADAEGRAGLPTDWASRFFSQNALVFLGRA